MGKNPTVLLNVFTLNRNEEETFVKRWNEVASYMKRQPGFISANLHKSVGENGRWFNYAEWESPEKFRAAVSTEEFNNLTKHFPGEGRPELFQKVEALRSE